ncbi:uncharacterized protein LOC106647711 [Copidosoma floridanum]|uniref:uncharacterized protein LOC106647711 n=1 Tax=Copidosoma floridanum TaxID=29053 RepID=UPI0006C9B1F6|nr:uncharacterized protein LOC106647711 [Copidosoma floridanum]XP_014219703.1 uncharacterized protein LOC106647711 [Copidosoma floridanum]
MGASVRPREFDVDQPSHTEQLAHWIDKVRTKKIIRRRSRKRDLRVEAVLTHVLSKAESELRSKQMSRIMRWQQMRQRLLEEDEKAYKDGGFQDGGDKDGKASSSEYGVICAVPQEQYSTWNGSFCQELSSLDTFMSQLSQIKVPARR